MGVQMTEKLELATDQDTTLQDSEAETRWPSFTPSSDSQSVSADSQDQPSPPKEEEKEPDKKGRRKSKKKTYVEVEPAWKKDSRWVRLACDHKLTPPARRVFLSCTSELLGEEVYASIPPNGAWIWKPDAEEILALGNLASCNADHDVRKPFFRAHTCAAVEKTRPEGPPSKEG